MAHGGSSSQGLLAGGASFPRPRITAIALIVPAGTLQVEACAAWGVLAQTVARRQALSQASGRGGCRRRRLNARKGGQPMREGRGEST